jgi:hypothetical protein
MDRQGHTHTHTHTHTNIFHNRNVKRQVCNRTFYMKIAFKLAKKINNFVNDAEII